MDLFKKCYEFTSADEAKSMGIYPYFHALESRQDKEVIMEGSRRIMLGSNNYLGLTANPEVIAAGHAALDKYGSGCSGSRFLNGTLDIHKALESELASFLGKEAVTTFSTGFQTNLGIISAITGIHDYVLCDRENHASIYDGIRLSHGRVLYYAHSDMEELESQLARVPDTCGKLIVTDGVFSMSGDICRLPEIVALAEKYGARVMVDDAHGMGVIGRGGRGTADYFGLTDKVDIIMNTFSKSLASLGGCMAADKKVIEYVMHNSRPFIFSASITPASCATARAALAYLVAHPELPERLQALSRYARSGFRKRNIAFRDAGNEIIPIIPIITRDAVNTLSTAKNLYDAGVYVNPVLPPAAPPDACLLRTSYMATLSEEIIDEAQDIIESVLRSMQ